MIAQPDPRFHNPGMESLYLHDLAYIHAVGFGSLARGAAPEIIRLFKGASSRIQRVVDVGCGAGPLTKALLDEGFDVTGIDSSADLLEIAHAVCPTARFVNASIYEIPIPICEAIVAVGEPLAYHDGPDADLLVSRFFRRIAAALPPGGMLIFDLIEPGEPSLANKSWSMGEDWAVLVQTTENQAERTLVREIETFRRIGEAYRRGREVHRIRLFDAASVCAELAACGFSTTTATSYGEQKLPLRRRVFIATREKQVPASR